MLVTVLNVSPAASLREALRVFSRAAVEGLGPEAAVLNISLSLGTAQGLDRDGRPAEAAVCTVEVVAPPSSSPQLARIFAAASASP